MVAVVAEVAEVADVALDAVPVKFPTKPPVEVVTPELEICSDTTAPTVIFGVPLSPAAVPLVFWLSVGILAASNVPEVILLADKSSILAAATGPEAILEPFKFVKLAPDPSVRSNVQLEFCRTTVAFPT